MDLSSAINGLEMEYVDISPLPFLNTDLEVNGTYRPVVEAFRRKILSADSILFASPEYNYSVSGAKSETFISIKLIKCLCLFFFYESYAFAFSMN